MPFQTGFSGQLGGIKGGMKSGVKDGVSYKTYSYGSQTPIKTGFSAHFGGTKGGIKGGIKGGSGEHSAETKKTINNIFKTFHHKDSEFGSGMGFGLNVGESSQQLLKSLLSADHNKAPKGCSSKPKQPMNAKLQCSSISNTCKATCISDYQFPNAATNLFISCVDGEWVIKDSEWSEIPSCERKYFMIFV